MGKLPILTSFFVGLCIAAAAVYEDTALGAECKRKTAGFYLQDTNANGPHRLSSSSQSVPVSLTGNGGDPERGRLILADRQKGDCLSCHKVSTFSSVADQGSIGPMLDGIGSRYSDGQLRQIVVDPKAYFPDTIMPSYYQTAGSSEASVLTAPEVEDLIAYMKTLK
jgi:L-cysteine S-thiosulfotransferase